MPGTRQHYSEYEAAKLLGITIEQLRSIVKKHILNGDELPEPGVLVLEQSDLLILKFLMPESRP